MVDLAIQIVNYKTKKFLIPCIGGVVSDLKDSKISYKILVLDNDSGDDLSDLAEEYKNLGVEFYFSGENLGFGAGHNLLAGKAESNYILILNPDLRFIESLTIVRLCAFLEEEKGNKVVAAGPKLLTGKGVQRWDHGELNGLWGRLSNKIGESHWKNLDLAAEVAWVSGAFFLILRQSFNEVEGFDEKFFLYKEEEDLCLRLRQKGYKIFYNPAVRVFHYGSVVASKSKFFAESDRYFFEKHFGKKRILIYLFHVLKQRIINKFLYWDASSA